MGNIKTKPQTLSDADLVAKTLANPVGYAHLRLNVNLHPKQKAVLQSLFNKRKSKVTVRTGNGVGKTSMIIVCAILYALEVLNAQVISTSATYRQVISQLMPNLKRFQHLYPKWIFKENAIGIDNIEKYIGFSTSDEGRWQGFHEQPGQPLLIIVDEAAGVHEDVYKAIDRCDPTFLLVVGSPLGPEGIFYKLESSEMGKAYDHFKISQLDCLKEDGYWIDRSIIDEMIAKWGKEHPLILSMVYADFAENVEGAILSLTAYDNCINNPPEYEEGKHVVALDFAAGGDENVIGHLNGNKFKLVKCWHNKDTMSAAAEFVIELNKLQKQFGIQPHNVYGDASGLGLPICHRLAELGWPVKLFYGQAAASQTDCYRNQIAECWLEGVKRIQNKSVIIDNDITLKAQVLSRKQRLNSSGKMELESKEDMRSRGVDSPDRADVFFMCMNPSNTSKAVTSVKRIEFMGSQNGYVGQFS